MLTFAESFVVSSSQQQSQQPQRPLLYSCDDNSNKNIHPKGVDFEDSRESKILWSSVPSCMTLTDESQSSFDSTGSDFSNMFVVRIKKSKNTNIHKNQNEDEEEEAAAGFQTNFLVRSQQQQAEGMESINDLSFHSFSSIDEEPDDFDESTVLTTTSSSSDTITITNDDNDDDDICDNESICTSHSSSTNDDSSTSTSSSVNYIAQFAPSVNDADKIILMDAIDENNNNNDDDDSNVLFVPLHKDSTFFVKNPLLEEQQDDKESVVTSKTSTHRQRQQQQQYISRRPISGYTVMRGKRVPNFMSLSAQYFQRKKNEEP